MSQGRSGGWYRLEGPSREARARGFLGGETVIAVVVGMERHSGFVPLCRTRDRKVASLVAQAALAEIRQALERQPDGTTAALLRNELERLERALAIVGLMDYGS